MIFVTGCVTLTFDERGELLDRQKMAAVGKRIREARKSKRLTQIQFGSLIGKTESTVRKYESGGILIPSNVLQSIAEVLDVSPFSLMGADYWDAKMPEISEIVTSLEIFIGYLKSIGCAVTELSKDIKIPASFIPDAFRESSDSNGDLIGETYSVTVRKAGIETEFSEDEFQAFQAEIEQSVEYQLWKKAQSR